MSESNIDTGDTEQLNRRARRLSGFNFLNKLLPGSSTARLSIYVDKKLEAERVMDLKNSVNSSAVIKIRRQRNKWTFVVESYRQWKA